MNKAIQLLEILGKESSIDLEKLIINTGLERKYIESIILSDTDTLIKLLDINTDIICMVVPAEDEEEDKKEQEDDETSETKENKLAIGF